LKLGEWLERGEVVVLGEDSFLPPAAGRARLLKHLEGFGRAVERAEQARVQVGELGRPRPEVRVRLGQEVESHLLQPFVVQGRDAVGQGVVAGVGSVHPEILAGLVEVRRTYM
jgi:hypothetical protein